MNWLLLSCYMAGAQLDACVPAGFGAMTRAQCAAMVLLLNKDAPPSDGDARATCLDPDGQFHLADGRMIRFVAKTGK